MTANLTNEGITLKSNWMAFWFRVLVCSWAERTQGIESSVS